MRVPLKNVSQNSYYHRRHASTPMSQSLCRSLQIARQCTSHQRLVACINASLPRIRSDDDGSLQPHHHRPNQQRRPFSSQPCLRSGVRQSRPAGKQRTTPSMNLLQQKQEREALSSGTIPDDIGLLPGTFIMPFGANRPSWTQNFGLRWRFEKTRWKTRFIEFYM